jgi:hypothetical protein
MSTLNVDRIVDASGGVMAPISSVNKNRIINGSMVLDQRNAGASVTPTANGTYTLDRLQMSLSNASKYSVQQSSTAPAGFSNSLLVTSLATTALSANDFYSVLQAIEGFNTSDFGFGTANAKTVTLSFWVRSSLTGTFGGFLQNSANNRSYPFSYTISAANTFEYKTITIAGDTSGTWIGATNGVGLFVGFSLGMGTDRISTANSWQTGNYRSVTGETSVVGTNGATWYITGVQLEVGTQATSFEYRQYTTELQLCQRYYYKIFPEASARALSTSGQCFSTTGAIALVSFPVTMRTRPTALEQNGTAGHYRLLNANSSANACTAVPTFNVTTTQNAAVLEGTVSSGLVAGNATYMNTADATAFLAWSAEL